ncbi:MAG: acyl-CoA dehydrogenase family protein, partial [Betaproteobacteria bacterium]|nr:acyl-CoA dehydrogenase family protein [Betaproteobacteria bacterium]
GGRMLGCFCLTEPHAGSDASAIRTRAVRDGGHWVLNGVKQFITSGKNADVAIVFAVTNPAAGKKGISAFVVPTSTPGYVVARIEDKLGQHASEMAERVCSDAIQIHGGYGYVADFPVERIWRDVRVCQIYEGASDIQRLVIARAIAGD